MIEVLKYGDLRRTKNPATGEWQLTRVVTFLERGRSGADVKMKETSDILSALVNQQSGIDNVRTHSHPILTEALDQYPLGKKFDLFISRGLYSFPQIQQQSDKFARMIDGKPTYFKTWLSPTQDADVDERMSNDNLMKDPRGADIIFNATLSPTDVETVESVAGAVHRPGSAPAPAEVKRAEAKPAGITEGAGIGA